MIVLLAAFTAFHFLVGIASLALAVRLWLPEERALWRSRAALLVAELLCWIYPIAAIASVRVAWREFSAGAEAAAFPPILLPIGWLILMGAVFAVVDLMEDGVLGNARRRGP
jgi:hypothetical protein